MSLDPPPPEKAWPYTPVNEPCMLTTKLRLVQSVVKGDLARSENRKVKISPRLPGLPAAAGCRPAISGFRKASYSWHTVYESSTFPQNWPRLDK